MKREKYYYFLSAAHAFFKRLQSKPNTAELESILIVKLDELGDFITSLPAIIDLRKSLPNVKIDLCVKPYLKRIAEAQEIANRVVSSFDQIDSSYSMIVELRGNWEFRSIRKKIKHTYFIDRGTVRLRNKFFSKHHPHEVMTNYEIVEQSGLVFAQKEPSKWLKWNARNVKAAELYLQRNVIGDYVIFHTGARKKLRQWHPQKFAEIAKYVLDKFNWDVVFVGADEDRRGIDKIQSQIDGKTFSFAGQGSIMDFAALVSRAKFMIGNESGPMHLAAASGTPVIALFGPGEPHVFSPYGSGHKILHHKLECNPCDQINCKYPNNPCINRITLQEVKHAIEEIIGEQSEISTN